MERIVFFLKSNWGVTIGLFIVLFYSFSIVGFSLEFFPGDLADGRFNNFILEHDYLFFIDEVEFYWDAGFMYPEPAVISYSDNLLGTAPFYAMFRWLFDRETSYQLWFVLMTLFNFISAYLFLKIVFKDKDSAVVGALVFAISMVLYGQVSHAQTFVRFPIPIAFLFCFLFLKDLKPVYFFGIVFTVVYQIYCGIYLGFFLLIPVAIFVFIILGVKWKTVLRKIKEWRWLVKMIGVIILNGLFLAPLLLPYLKRSTALNPYTYDHIFSSLPTVESFLFSPTNSLLWSFLNETAKDYGDYWDHYLFVGGIAVFSMIFFFSSQLKKIFKGKADYLSTNNIGFFIFSIVGLTTFLLFIRTSEFSFYRIIYSIPGFTSLRSLTRIINVELIFFAFAVAYFTRIVLQKYKRYSSLIFSLIIVLFLVDNYIPFTSFNRTSKLESQVRINGLVEKMEKFPKGSVVSYEPFKNEEVNIYSQIDAMIAAQSLGLKSINGYSATAPYVYDKFWGKMDEESRMEWLKFKKMDSLTVYVIH